MNSRLWPCAIDDSTVNIVVVLLLLLLLHVAILVSFNMLAFYLCRMV